MKSILFSKKISLFSPRREEKRARDEEEGKRRSYPHYLQMTWTKTGDGRGREWTDGRKRRRRETCNPQEPF